VKAFYAQAPIWSDTIQLGIGERTFDGSRSRLTAVLDSVQMRAVKDGEYVGTPTLELTPDEARGLMDALWQAGVRPSNGTGNAGQLGATEKHLEDMRRLVFDSLLPKCKESP
jgi:hypothetical protein